MMTQPSVPTTSGSQRNSSDSQNTGQSLDQFQNRQNPLKYIIPFVEHLHQSLHAGDNRQRGGNDVQVEFMSQINYKPPAGLKE